MYKITSYLAFDLKQDHVFFKKCIKPSPLRLFDKNLTREINTFKI